MSEYEPIYWNEAGQNIGHTFNDAREWLAQHPTYIGSVWFDNRDGGDHVDVTDDFATDEDVAAMVTRPAATVAGSVNLLDAVRDAKWFADIHEMSRGEAA